MRMTALAIHIIAGSLGIIFGFVALYAAKGAKLHRKSGMLFVYTLTTMALMGATMAAVWGRDPASNIPVGLLTAYLVITGLTAVRPPSSGMRQLDLGLMLVALAVGLELFTFGIMAVESPGHMLSGNPVPFFIFGSIALLASVGDIRLIRSGGSRAVRGAPRLARHLWRMCTALLIAAFSFFLGQAKVIPKPIRIPSLLVIPPLVVLVAMLYWLWRVRIRRNLRGIASRSTAVAARAHA
jgi:uncharacterized membrane protein